MPAQAEGAGLLSFPLASRSAGLASEQRGPGLQHVPAERGEARLIFGRERGTVSPPDLGGRRESWFLFLFFFLSLLQTLGLWGQGDRCGRAPCPGSCRKAPAWGRDPAGAAWAKVGGTGGAWGCRRRARAPGCAAPSPGRHRPRRSAALTAVFVRSPFRLHGSHRAQDGPINPALVILFCYPLPLFLWPSPDFALVPFLFRFFALLAWSPWAGAHRFPVSSSLALLVSFAVASTTQTTSVTKLVLTGRSPVPECSSWPLTAWLRWHLAAGGSRTLPEQPLAWPLLPPQKHKAECGPGDGLSHQARMPWVSPPQRAPAGGGRCFPIPSVLGGTTCPTSPRCCWAWVGW